MRFAIALALCLLAVAAHAATPASRWRAPLSAALVRYSNVEGAPTAWRTAAPGRSVLVVLDPRRRLSHELLDDLARNGYGGERARVVVLGSDAAATAFYARAHATLPQAEWVFAERSDIDANLVLAGTPLVLGLEADRHVAWRASGMARDTGKLLVHIADWTGLAAQSH